MRFTRANLRRCDLTVVIAHVDPGASLSGSVAAVDRACADLRAEIVVAQWAGLAPTPAPRTRRPLRVLRVAGNPLVPQLWAQGLRAAGGEYVAFTLANCEVSVGWARALMAGFEEGAKGVGGPIECAPDAAQIDRALYYLRYSAFMPSCVTNGMVMGEIPGDNAAYAREALDRHRDVIADGFWEVLFHDRLRRNGGRLCMRHDASARFCGGVSLGQAIRHRFAHGRHFGAWRIAERHRHRWQIGVAAPVVPLLLALRAGSRVMRSSARRWPFVSALPIFLVIAAAWAVGEAVGAVCGPGLPEVAADADLLKSEPDAATSAAAAVQG